jgi:hypothetical protein
MSVLGKGTSFRASWKRSLKVRVFRNNERALLNGGVAFDGETCYTYTCGILQNRETKMGFDPLKPLEQAATGVAGDLLKEVLGGGQGQDGDAAGDIAAFVGKAAIAALL